LVTIALLDIEGNDTVGGSSVAAPAPKNEKKADSK